MHSTIKFILFSSIILFSIIGIVNYYTSEIDPLQPTDFNQVAIYIWDQRVYKPFVIETGTIEYSIIDDNFKGPYQDYQFEISNQFKFCTAIFIIRILYLLFKNGTSNKSNQKSTTSQQLENDIELPSINPIEQDPISTEMDDQQLDIHHHTQDQPILIIFNNNNNNNNNISNNNKKRKNKKNNNKSFKYINIYQSKYIYKLYNKHKKIKL